MSRKSELKAQFNYYKEKEEDIAGEVARLHGCSYYTDEIRQKISDLVDQQMEYQDRMEQLAEEYRNC